jgi:putative nucleotidyltransferase with HDIG domain
MPSSAAPTIPWHRSLEARVLLSLLLIAGLSTAALGVAAHRIVTGYSLQRSRAEMAAAQRTFQRLTLNRAASVAAECRLITELPIFVSLMTDARVLSERDAATIQAMTQEYRRKLKAEFGLVTDAQGRWLGRAPGYDSPGDRAVLSASIRAAQSGEDFEGIVELDQGLYLVVSQPARYAEEVLGALTVGFRLDDALASEFAELTRSEVSFASSGRLHASSLPASERSRLPALFALPTGVLRGAEGQPALVRLGEETYVAGLYSLSLGGSGSAPGKLLLLESWRPAQRVLDAIQGSLLYVGALALAVSLALGLLVSRRLTRPLREIAVAAGEVAAGDWERQAPVRGNSEAAVLAAAFNHMTGNLRHYYQESTRHAELVATALSQLEASYSGTLQALSRALDTRDDDTEGHSQRVTYYALRLGDELGLDAETRTRLELGALLHDLGKIGIPDSILRKPGPHTPEEMRVMRTHCELGVEIVRGIPHLQGALDVIGHHHERFDGLGYPLGLRGEEIPLVARIFAVVDTLDAMTSDRPYRKACPFPQAVLEIRRCAGSQFDPQVVAALVGIYDEFRRWRESGDPPPLHHLRLPQTPLAPATSRTLTT